MVDWARVHRSRHHRRVGPSKHDASDLRGSILSDRLAGSDWRHSHEGAEALQRLNDPELHAENKDIKLEGLMQSLLYGLSGTQPGFQILCVGKKSSFGIGDSTVPKDNLASVVSGLSLQDWVRLRDVQETSLSPKTIAAGDPPCLLQPCPEV